MQQQLSSDCRVLIAMVAALGLPFGLTLTTITQPRPVVGDLSANPTPHGYTWSLSLFIVPVLALASWLARRRESRIQNQAFWFTLLFMDRLRNRANRV